MQRYLTGRSVTESRLGLVMNGLLKVPMQFFILFIGVLVFVFYQFYQPPIFFIEQGRTEVQASAYASDWQTLDDAYTEAFTEKKAAIQQYLQLREGGSPEAIAQGQSDIKRWQAEEAKLRQEAADLVALTNPQLETEDTDYVFLTFVMTYFPEGLVGLLLAVILSAAMSSTASELNALSTTTTVDIYRRLWKTHETDQHYLWASRGFTLLWGGVALTFAMTASLADNLIEFVNIVGSIFYGTVLGIFLVAFYVKQVQSRAVFVAGIVAQSTVILLFLIANIGYLWFNVIGCVLVVAIAVILQKLVFK